MIAQIHVRVVVWVVPAPVQAGVSINVVRVVPETAMLVVMATALVLVINESNDE